MNIKEYYYTSKEVKIILGITAQTLKRWKDSKKIRVKQFSPKKIWYLKEDVDNILEG